MDEIPQADRDEMELDRAPNSDFEDSEESDDDREEEEEDKEVFVPGKHKLEEGEELVRDTSAYVLYHEFQTGSPCLSFDIIKDDHDRSTSPYPATAYIVAGTMSRQKKDHLIVLKLSNMVESKEENEEDDEEQETDPAKQPNLTAAMIRHNGCINRVRAYNFSNETVLAANWSERGAVHIWNLAEQLKATSDKHAMSNFISNVQKNLTPVYSFDGFTNEGYALDWSTVKPGHLLSGDNSRNIHLFKPVDNASWSVEQRPYSGHQAAVEDIQWSPTEGSVFASCSTDKSVKIWDIRAPPNKACMISVDNAHDMDVNVISWNKKEPFIVSGGDDGVIKVWDLRKIQEKKSVAYFKHHTGPITSIEWCPQDSSVFAASGEDNQVTQWDLAVERESEENVDVPPQLLFVHQGQEDVKEIHWHSQIDGMLLSTANSGFNVFKTISV